MEQYNVTQHISNSPRKEKEAKLHIGKNKS